jgi:hypothetical protein
MTAANVSDWIVWALALQGFLQTVATIVIGWMPTPLELPGPRYRIVYLVVQRMSLHRPNWKKPGDKPGDNS